MKFLFFNHNVAWSGTFFRAYHLGRCLVKLGHEVTVVTTSRSARFVSRQESTDGLELIEMPDLLWGRGRTGWDPWNIMQRTLGLRGRAFDVVHAFDCRPAVILPAIFHARRLNLPLFVDWADWWGRGGSINERAGGWVNRVIGPLETWFEEAFRNHATGTTVISKALEQRAVGLGVEASTILRFPHGCETNKAVGARAAARAVLGIDEDVPVLIHVGQVYAGDFALLHDAFSKLLRALPTARLIMLGNTRLTMPTASFGGALIAPGYVDTATMAAWLAAANVAVLPLQDTVSARGRWPSKINEYFSAARAVVMPQVSDAAEYVEGERAGWTCAPDADAFAVALTEALTSPEAAAAAGANGRKLAEDRLHWSQLTLQLNDFYQHMLSATPRSSATIRLAAR